MIKEYNKKGQGAIGLSFQMIFSLILIAIFLYSAFTGIHYFINRADQAKIGQFVVGLKSNIQTIEQSTEAERDIFLQLPKKVKLVCFGDFSKKTKNIACPEFELYRQQAILRDANMFLCPPEAAYNLGAPVYYKIDCDGNKCLDFQTNMYCIANEGKIDINLIKKFGQPNVLLK